MKRASLFQAAHLARGVLGLVLVVGAAPAVFSQELLPELAVPAAQHKAAGEALDRQKLEAIALAAKSYVSALDSIEKAATAKGEIDLVAAVVKEREAVVSGTLEPSLPAALPKARLQMSRKTLLASVERINADFAKRKKSADAGYLRVLASLQPKAAANQELAKQLAAEKSALLNNGSAGAESEGDTKAAKQSFGKNVIVNGDFEKIVDGKPDGWDPFPLTAGRAKVETENKNTFVRFDTEAVNKDGTSEYQSLTQEIAVPKGASKIAVSAKLRTFKCAVPKSMEFSPCIFVKFANKDTAVNDNRCYMCWKGKNGSWQRLQSEGTLQADWVVAIVVIKNSKCPGQVDFDDVKVSFK